jgi:uncharacterized Rmd1/YagE family protein
MPEAKPTPFPEFAMLGALPTSGRLAIHAQLIGARIDTRDLAARREGRRMTAQAGLTFVFRDGVVVTANPPDLAAANAENIAATLGDRVIDPSPLRESETVAVEIGKADGLGQDGRILLADAASERLLLVAIVLARSVMLSRDEVLVGEAFASISPLVGDLSARGRTELSIRQAMRLVGRALAARHRIMATSTANDRPDLLWDHPELDRLYARLEAEYELDERAEVLERKFVALGDVTEVLLDIVRDKRAFRLELAIIALFVVEIVLSVVTMLHG